MATVYVTRKIKPAPAGSKASDGTSNVGFGYCPVPRGAHEMQVQVYPAPASQLPPYGVWARTQVEVVVLDDVRENGDPVILEDGRQIASWDSMESPAVVNAWVAVPSDARTVRIRDVDDAQAIGLNATPWRRGRVIFKVEV